MSGQTSCSTTMKQQMETLFSSGTGNTLLDYSILNMFYRFCYFTTFCLVSWHRKRKMKTVSKFTFYVLRKWIMKTNNENIFVNLYISFIYLKTINKWSQFYTNKPKLETENILASLLLSHNQFLKGQNIKKYNIKYVRNCALQCLTSIIVIGMIYFSSGLVL